MRTPGSDTASGCRWRLEQHDIVYCVLDAVYLKLRPDDQPAEGVLVCWGVTLEGRKVLLGLALGSRESYGSWLVFGRDMIARGMCAPVLVVAGARDLEGCRRALARGARAALHCALRRLRGYSEMGLWALVDGGDRGDGVGIIGAD